MLGGQMAGGGIGVAVPEELILMHAVLEMGVGADPSALRRFAPLFVEAVERWRARAKDICEGRDVPKDASPAPGGRSWSPSWQTRRALHQDLIGFVPHLIIKAFRSQLRLLKAFYVVITGLVRCGFGFPLKKRKVLYRNHRVFFQFV